MSATKQQGISARIRWTEQWPGTVYGHPGTLDSWGFELWLSDGHGDFETGEWVLTVPFIFGDHLSMNGHYKLSDRDPEKLKAGAERLLEEFISSLGAIFKAPDLPQPNRGTMRDLTCGACGTEFGTNFDVDQIDCPECDARRCPCCGEWFGGE